MKYRLLVACLAWSAFAAASTPASPPSDPASLPDPLVVDYTEAVDPLVAELLFGDFNRVLHPDLWSRIRVGFALTDLDSPLVEKWENYYASRPDYLRRIVERGSRYLYFVVAEVEKRGMPMEIALLPMIESAYNPKAESHAGAGGMWQFIPETGKRYGLERTWWYDGRRDVVASTQAALDYLQTLYGLFGDWQLALASYNWGEGAVGRALARNREAGLPLSYADIRKPAETENYVPKLLAVRNIIADPDAFGVDLGPLPNDPYFTAITTGRHMDVQVAAELAQLPVDELLRLNPGFIRPVIAYKDERKLVLPADKVELFQRNLAAYERPLLNWQPYVTRAGESLDELARTHGIPAEELREINDIPPREQVARGQTILVPLAPGMDIRERVALNALAVNKVPDPVDTGEQDAPRAVRKPQDRYRVGRGDTLFSIAQRFNLSVDELKSLNRMRGNQIRAGQQLKVTQGVVADQPGKRAGRSRAQRARTYLVRRGDTLSEISRRYNVALVDLKRWNPRPLRPGMKVYVEAPN
ncbi:LysM peptidoglycan-binding domain-containing protein [Chitiniphilus purpureus]|uniref:LysM peptidoglycan-binding domain-containing protein n=1 Tax=Chitiniphilus purpureus TaxID=2981137 RepID=A0ABY6DJQ3_9NEIS|nr:LysM peptidoglycan-binding domain-containing protein [Chitiniphilus sp. CD1]UXY14463.1 LysM peptidoglycan-binding domain-containing protein [Chitiniphilus sp. CD1]